MAKALATSWTIRMIATTETADPRCCNELGFLNSEHREAVTSAIVSLLPLDLIFLSSRQCYFVV